jgi:hypothetical protein
VRVVAGFIAALDHDSEPVPGGLLARLSVAPGTLDRARRHRSGIAAIQRRLPDFGLPFLAVKL